MITLLVLFMLLVLFVIGIWVTVSLLGLLVTLVVAFCVGWLADKVVPGSIPYGWLGAIVAGLLGAWIGGILLGDAGPELGGIALIPAFVGALGLAFALDFIAKTQRPEARG